MSENPQLSESTLETIRQSEEDYAQDRISELKDADLALHSGTVWVVAALMMDNPHPEVLGVYTNEDAAREHEQAIRDNHGTIKGENGYDWPVASFDTHEVDVETSYVGAKEESQ